MANEQHRELLRQEYQKKDYSEKTYIPAKPKADLYGANQMYRVCAYCRVSTDNDEQLSSFELQRSHYENLAAERPNWELKRIFADEGISGTSLKNRDSFIEMIEECKQGKYDLIITKSVSRFARNLVDCLTTIRMLKDLPSPVGVFFETDNLYTLGENSEIMLSLLAMFAQDESVKKSEAMIWSLNQRFKEGKLLTPSLLGYDRPRDVTGRYIKYAPLEINEEEAKLVRFIYDAYLAGWSQEDIAAFLTDIRCRTKTGSAEWTTGTIGYILSNERYCGNVLTWKTFTANMFEHKHRKNNKDRDQYLYLNQHPAIISREKFEAVQVLQENRKHHLKGGLPALRVIAEGIFKGFVPINHHWVNDDPGIYYDISNSVKTAPENIRVNRTRFSSFDLSGYQVVRSEFTQIRYEGPSISFTKDRISFNKFCVQRYGDVAFIQLLLHPAERKVAIRPCMENAVHSIKWRPDTDKPVSSKSFCCQHFMKALYAIMEWDPAYSYKLRGTWAQRGKEQIIVFNLLNATPVMTMTEEGEDGKSVQKRVTMYPAEWGDDFGEEFYEHSLENGLRFISPNAEWNSQAESIEAPGLEQFEKPSEESLKMKMDILKRGEEVRDGE